MTKMWCGVMQGGVIGCDVTMGWCEVAFFASDVVRWKLRVQVVCRMRREQSRLGVVNSVERDFSLFLFFLIIFYFWGRVGDIDGGDGDDDGGYDDDDGEGDEMMTVRMMRCQQRQ